MTLQLDRETEIKNEVHAARPRCSESHCNRIARKGGMRCTIHDGSDARRIVRSLNLSLVSQLLEVPFLGWISTYKDDMETLQPVVDKSRLTQLESYGLIEPIDVPERGRWAYALTDKGRTVVIALRQSGARRDDKTPL